MYIDSPWSHLNVYGTRSRRRSQLEAKFRAQIKAFHRSTLIGIGHDDLKKFSEIL